MREDPGQSKRELVLRGCVVDGDGRPVPWALVSVSHSPVFLAVHEGLIAAGQADGEGCFALTLDSMPRDEVLLTVRYSLDSLRDVKDADDRVQRQRALLERIVQVDDDRPIVARLALPVQIRGTVSGLAADRAGASVEFVALEVGDAGGETLHSAGTYIDDAGRFRLEHVPPGTYRVELCLEQPDGTEVWTAVAEQLVIEPGSNDVTLTLRDDDS